MLAAGLFVVVRPDHDRAFFRKHDGRTARVAGDAEARTRDGLETTRAAALRGDLGVREERLADVAGARELGFLEFLHGAGEVLVGEEALAFGEGLGPRGAGHERAGTNAGAAAARDRSRRRRVDHGDGELRRELLGVEYSQDRGGRREEQATRDVAHGGHALRGARRFLHGEVAGAAQRRGQRAQAAVFLAEARYGWMRREAAGGAGRRRARHGNPALGHDASRGIERERHGRIGLADDLELREAWIRVGIVCRIHRIVERVGELLGVLEALVGIAFERALEPEIERDRDLRVHVRRNRQGLRGDGGERHRDALVPCSTRGVR